MTMFRRRRIGWRQAAGIAALLFLLTPFAVGVNGCFTLVALVATSGSQKEQRIVAAGDAIYLDPGQEIRAHLRDGTTLLGRFAGRALLTGEAYVQRFEGHSARGGWTPLALGESLAVQMDDGRTLVAAFAGYATRALVLHAAGDSAGTRVPFQSARSVRHQAGSLVSLDSLIAADVRGELPSAEAIALLEGESSGIAWREGAGKRVVALEDIERVTIGKKPGNPAGLILAGMAVDVVILVALSRSAQSQPSCDLGPNPATLLGHLRTTERPFDRVTATFVNENLAWPDSLPFQPEPVRGTH